MRYVDGLAGLVVAKAQAAERLYEGLLDVPWLPVSTSGSTTCMH